jgi:hypothetical protein
VFLSTDPGVPGTPGSVPATTYIQKHVHVHGPGCSCARIRAFNRTEPGIQMHKVTVGQGHGRDPVLYKIIVRIIVILQSKLPGCKQVLYDNYEL